MKKQPAILEYFENLPVGEVINKKGLAYLKRLGYIWDYSQWGYLEDLMISTKAEEDGYRSRHMMYLFDKGNAKEAELLDGAMREKWRQTRAKCELTTTELFDRFGSGNHFTLNGIYFTTEYFDGCFNPYLVKAGPHNGKCVNHRMAFPGGVV